jgi:hypothetical protein
MVITIRASEQPGNFSPPSAGSPIHVLELLKGKSNAGLLYATYCGLDWLIRFPVERLAADRFP